MGDAGSSDALRILLVEDDAPLAGALRRLLERAGYEVYTAADGLAAIDFVAKQRVDLVISDLFMPEADGIELINFLRRLTPRPPVLAMSGGGQARLDGMLRVAGALGAARVLPKPFHAEELLALVRELVGPSSAGASRLAT